MTTFATESEMKGLCPVCLQETTVQQGRRQETFTVRGDAIEIEAEVRRCTACGEFFAGLEDEDRNFEKAYRTYRERHGLLQPEDIRSIREQYGLGQRAFSKLLGWGEVTLHRYEGGALQDEAHNNELLLLSDPTNFQRLLEKNRHKLPRSISPGLDSRLQDLVRTAKEGMFVSWLESFFGETRDDILSGYRRFDLERLQNVVLFICDRTAGITRPSLGKVLWYCDFLSFRANTQSITGLTYERTRDANVPRHFDYFLAYIRERGALTSEEVFHEHGPVTEVLRNVDRPDLSLFNRAELDVLRQVVDVVAKLGPHRIAHFLRMQDAYQRTCPGEVVSYEWAASTKLAWLDIGSGDFDPGDFFE